jgi:uncharacterized protein YqfA (UPF0365 family)
LVLVVLLVLVGPLQLVTVLTVVLVVFLGLVHDTFWVVALVAVAEVLAPL